MEQEMISHSSTEVVVTKRKKKRLILFFVILACFIGWQLFGDTIKEGIDRELVRNARYVAGETVHKSGTRPGSSNRLILPNGQWVIIGSDVKCYATSLSHHSLFGLRSGYSYVQVNGKMYGKPTGPCRNSIHVVIEVDPMDSESVVTEEIVVQGLVMGGFHLIP
jgi:hypothetical protein